MERLNQTPNQEKNEFAETNRALRGIMVEMAALTPALNVESKKLLFDRMLHGSEIQTEDPALLSLFEKVADVEDEFGADKVAEVAAFYFFTPEGNPSN